MKREDYDKVFNTRVHPHICMHIDVVSFEIKSLDHPDEVISRIMEEASGKAFHIFVYHIEDATFHHREYPRCCSFTLN